MPRQRLALLLFAFPWLGAWSLAGCGGGEPAKKIEVGAPALPAWFQDISDQVKLDFHHDPGPVAGFFMPQSMGSGAALADLDNDGRLDILLLNNGGPKGRPNQLFLQQQDGALRNASVSSGLDFPGYNMGAAVGDVNNDGLLDLVVTQYRGVKLLMNKGEGKFADVTEAAGLSNPAWGMSAAFLDYDADGWLDLVIVNYIELDPAFPCPGPFGQGDYCHPRNFPGSASRLFRNLGPAKKPGGAVLFADCTQESGLGAKPSSGLGVLCADLNGDGKVDIFVANDGRPNHLWINQGHGKFSEEATLRGLAFNFMGQTPANMGVAYGDVDGDGLPDLFVTHLTEETHTLWRQIRPGQFQDETARRGLTNPRWRGTGWGTALADFDLDGWLDLALVNGRVAARAPLQSLTSWAAREAAYGEKNQLFRNDGKGNFQDISLHNPDWSGFSGIQRGLAVGDVDGDGALDLLVTAAGNRARLLRNQSVQGGGGHWLSVRALDHQQRDALGASIRVRTKERVWVSGVHPEQSYLCANDPRVHFGLGSCNQVEAIQVRWPGGLLEEFPPPQVNRLCVVRQGRGRPVSK